ncbi:hypothetical protein FRB94_008720 [Tulasnella sp. JGI-2019a]|nr:hypothetical protein FRB94_008720 [Tulasnella sp. JGI-2019a]KAG9028269.1 hypothetical protein FRB95_006635 [Tulasnella sp. JGI-2019a]
MRERPTNPPSASPYSQSLTRGVDDPAPPQRIQRIHQQASFIFSSCQSLFAKALFFFVIHTSPQCINLHYRPTEHVPVSI